MNLEQFSLILSPLLRLRTQTFVMSNTLQRMVVGAFSGASTILSVKDKKNIFDIQKGVSKDGTRSEFKRLDRVYNSITCSWVDRESVVQQPTITIKQHADFAFLFIRELSPTPNPEIFDISTKYEIQSPLLRKIGQEVIGRELGISWTANTVTLEPEVLMAFLPRLDDYLSLLHSKHSQTSSPDEDNPTEVEHLTLLLDFVKAEHASTLQEIKSLLENEEITFDLAWVLFVPRTVLYTLCPVSNAPRAVRLIKTTKDAVLRMEVEYMEYHGGEPRYGLAPLSGIILPHFQGTVKISTLPTYPLEYHPQVETLTTALIERGKKWCSLQGVYLKYYDAMSFQFTGCGYFKHRTQSRIIIDKKTFQQINPNYFLPAITKTLTGESLESNVQSIGGVPGQDGQWWLNPQSMTPPPTGMYYQMANGPQIPQGQARDEENHFNATPPDDDLLLASPLVYGFGLTDKLWVEFSVESVQSFTWNDEPFTNLVLARDQKSMILSLVESHMLRASKNLDDFVRGKGQGLVINLFGNPGIGKSLTAEATSEHVRKPLYVVGAGDLGTTPNTLDSKLTTIFTVSSRWGAVVLIDEADVFLEERSLHDLNRNAMVAVFLRQLEYFRGILFLTTNRVRTFDRAFQSRIHVSLKYRDLTSDAKRQIWTAFLKKAVASSSDIEASGSEASKTLTSIGVSDEELHELGEKSVNGRQIKNVVLTAGALALARKQTLGFGHLIEVLDMIEQFEST
ncbi:P-loop containing nucleoside triphosphate hydrolase protein [Schizopora paradoxa]|uniref:p-loop containing nucleoside triphosphate hydrolase protein n=1 Tax=Schizopora paradoxa TaxID=27342 RepID=A0A0H2R5K6_9AGAM|nr:P-loop containing nucleoside triphosphate hydrolase protein [Schizopora paradoxa]